MQPDSHNDSIDTQIKKIEDMRAKFLEQERTSSADRLALNQAVDKLEALLSGDSEYPQIPELAIDLKMNVCLQIQVPSVKVLWGSFKVVVGAG